MHIEVPLPKDVLPQELKKSTLDAIRAQLKTNPGVYYPGDVVNSETGTCWDEIVDMIVSPVRPFGTLQELNDFMHSLVKGVNLKIFNDACLMTDGRVELGNLRFEEHFGTLVGEGVEFIGQPGNSGAKELLRGIWLRVYPTPDYAKTIYDYLQGVQEGTVMKDSVHEDLRMEINLAEFDILMKGQDVQKTEKVAILNYLRPPSFFEWQFSQD